MSSKAITSSLLGASLGVRALSLEEFVAERRYALFTKLGFNNYSREDGTVWIFAGRSYTESSAYVRVATDTVHCFAKRDADRPHDLPVDPLLTFVSVIPLLGIPKIDFQYFDVKESVTATLKSDEETWNQIQELFLGPAFHEMLTSSTDPRADLSLMSKLSEDEVHAIRLIVDKKDTETSWTWVSGQALTNPLSWDEGTYAETFRELITRYSETGVHRFNRSVFERVAKLQASQP